jgi:uncharacterized protein (DUF1778 family)
MTFRMSKGDASLVAAAATIGGRDFSAFVRAAAVKQARRQLADVLNDAPAEDADHG